MAPAREKRAFPFPDPRYGWVIGVILAFFLAYRARAWPEGSLDGPYDASWRNLSGLTMIALERWLAQPLSFHFDWAIYFSPDVPEWRSLDSLYTSYPPGFLLVPFLLAKILPGIAIPLLLKWLGLVWCLFLALAVGEICRQLSESAVSAFAGAVFILFFSPDLFFLGNAWFADFYVLLPWALSLLAELYRKRKGETPWFEAALFFFGLIGEWLFWVYFALIFFLRWREGALGSLRSRLSFLVPAALSLWIYLWPIARHGLLAVWLGRIGERTGLSLGYRHILSRFVTDFWFGMVPQIASWFWLLLFGVVVAVFLWQAAKGKIPLLARRIGFLALAPVLLHSVLLVGHYYEHSYPMVKLGVVFAVLAFGVCPSLVRNRLALSLLAASAVLLAGEQLWAYRKVSALVVGTKRGSESLCAFVRGAARPEDIWFSAEYAVEPFRERDESFRDLPLCGRYIYKVSAREYIDDEIAKLKQKNQAFHWASGNSAVFVEPDPESAGRFVIHRWLID